MVAQQGYYAHQPLQFSQRPRLPSAGSAEPNFANIARTPSAEILIKQQRQPQQQQPAATTHQQPMLLPAPPSHARGARARLALSAPTRPVAHPRLSRRRPPDVISDEPPSALLQQLAKLSASSDSLIRDMRKTINSRFDRTEVVLQLNTRYLLVGKCDSRFAGIAHFLPTKVVYAFEHPLHRHVEMHMAYADMLGVRLQPPSVGAAGGARVAAGVTIASGAAPLELRFRIGAPLNYFSREYDCNDQAHDLRIGFANAADLDRFKQLALPHLERLSLASAGSTRAPAASSTTSRPPSTSSGSRAAAPLRSNSSLSATT